MSGEDYLEAIFLLQRQMGAVRSIDVARHMGYTKASVSRAVSLLKEGGLVTVDGDGFLLLTPAGRETAAYLYDKHCTIASALVALGVRRRPLRRTPAAWNTASATNPFSGSRPGPSAACESGQTAKGAPENPLLFVDSPLVSARSA